MSNSFSQGALPDIVTCLGEALGSLELGHVRVQARVSGHRLLLRLEGEPLPEPDSLLASLAPTLEHIALTWGQRHVELFGFLTNEGIPEWHRQWEGQVQLNPNGTLYRAKQGDVEAIHYLLNYLLRNEGIHARIHLNRKLGLLQINLQAVEPPDPAWAKDFMRRTLARLELTFLQQLRLSGQKLGSFLPTWSQEFDLKQASFWQVPPVRARVPWVQDRPDSDPSSEEDPEPQRTDAPAPELEPDLAYGSVQDPSGSPQLEPKGQSQ
ncbi:hypothetical protein L1047_07170 [Synechococcus sp. Nb3U1]|uniref:hypothetical protein n=1 Tax=Synechococcus sp. Nb3U1 TaxID=1914529 RepID=UPI001F288321|nr:hypothetical protein [Synechococcus sp. Nb3U1]MCF2970970.1 hypothetical protein [Synechococcus sp. Nb3U1]